MAEVADKLKVFKQEI